MMLLVEKFHLRKSRLDFNAEDKIEKVEIENKINQLVKDDHKISYQWITL